MDFSRIIGQQDVITSLLRSLSEDRVGHAYVFSGPDGLGKRSIAHIFAGLLLCDNPQNGTTCGTCSACQLYENGGNPDYRRIHAEEASIGVDQIRTIQGDVTIRPMYSRRKVYVVEDAERMTDQAQNCLLKTFEEPPKYVVVILITSNYETLLETIRSRAQHLPFRKYSREQVCRVLSEAADVDSALVSLAADYSDGNIGVALELAGSGEFSQLRERTLELMTGIAGGRLRETVDFISLMEENKENAGLILDVMLLYFRDLLVLSETGDEKMLINSDKKDMILNNARMCRSQRVIKHIGAVGGTRRAIRQNANYQLAIDDLLIKLREDS